MTVSPRELAEKIAVIRDIRGDAAGAFDVAVFGYSEPGDDSLSSAYEAAGATWWLEYFHDKRGPLEATHRRIAGGPG